MCGAEGGRVSGVSSSVCPLRMTCEHRASASSGRVAGGGWRSFTWYGKLTVSVRWSCSATEKLEAGSSVPMVWWMCANSETRSSAACAASEME